MNACNVVSSFLICMSCASGTKDCETDVLCINVCVQVFIYIMWHTIYYILLCSSPVCTYVYMCMCVCVHIRTTYTAYVWLHDCLPFPPMNGMHAGDLPVVAEEFDTTLNIRDGYI